MTTSRSARTVALALVWFGALLVIALLAGGVDTMWRRVSWLVPPDASDVRTGR